MLLKPKYTHSSKEEYENKIIVEKWIKRTSNTTVTIGEDVSNQDTNVKKYSKALVKDDSTKRKELNDSKTHVLKYEPITNRKANSFIESYKSINNKRPQHHLSNEMDTNLLNTKLLRKSLPMKCNQFMSVKKDLSVKTDINKKCDSEVTNNKIIKVKCANELINDSEKGKNLLLTAVKHESDQTIINKDKITDVNSTCKNDLKYLFGEETKTDVYNTILDNYRYLITPKSWSVTEFINENKDRYVVFFNTHVVKESDTLISVIRKSLVIDKGAIINYSVHGLPVDIKGTILPKFLDSTKKLLSILHIFDKMQVCDGIGSDLNLTQTELIFKDNCRFWRHKHCKLVLIKSKRCPTCTETRILEFNKKTIFKTD